MKAGEKTTVSRPLPVWRFWGLALFVAFVFGTLWVSPVQAETDTGGSCITIKVYKFEDKDGDGTKDSNEDYLSGWTFTLTKPDNTTVSGTTGSHGDKTFNISSCAYGTYTLTETLQSGWYNTTGGLSQSQEITANNKIWTATFGNAKYSTIKVRKFEDKNGNGNKDSGEGWLNDWTFTLSDSGGNTIGSGSTSGSGSSAGSLIFGNLVSGTYTVTETLQNGYLSTTGLNQSVSLGYAETKEIKFGNAQLAEICIYKFKDLDGDGAKDEGEPYLPNWTFKLYDAQDNYIGEATTQDHGGGEIKATFWVFVPYNQSKTFKAVEQPQQGYYPTTPTQQWTTSISYGGWAELFFGNAPYGEIKVYKFEDLDGDGTWDIGEPPLPDWEFQLSQSQFITSGVTGQNGSLLFGNLKAGDYTVTEVLSDDYQPTTSNPQSTSVTPGQQATLTFGNQRYDMDYGDLPDSELAPYKMTLFSANGARHKPLGTGDVWLGEKRDAEYDGIPHSAAMGDDGHNDKDEDGIKRGPSWGGGTGVILVTVSGAPGCLTGWVDYFNEGSEELGIDYKFSESFSYNSNTYTEKVIDLLLLTPGTHSITFTLPPDFANTSVFARFRLVPALWNGDDYHCDRATVELYGLEIGGEVEDYYWQFGPTAVDLKKVSAVPQQSTVGFGLAAAGLVVSLTALLVGRRRRK